MPSAEIITIGTELLLGEIVDTNSRFLAKSLRNAGIDLFRITTVGDNVARIAQAIRQSLNRCDIVLTTGGLGPTVDDPTRDAVAEAVGVSSVFQPELWEQIKDRFQKLGRLPTDNNRRQAYIPAGATSIENPVGTAPIFVFEHGSKLIIALPGVPSEMSYLMDHAVLPLLRQRFDLHEVIRTRILHTVGVGESQIDDQIGDLEQYTNPTVGLSAHFGQVDIRITVKAESVTAAESLVQPVEATLRERLGDSIYGVDDETLEDVALRSLASKNLTICVLEAGTGGDIIRRLAPVGRPFLGGQVLSELTSPEELVAQADTYRASLQADAALGVVIHPSPGAQVVSLVLLTPHGSQQVTRRYAGAPEYAPLLAFNLSLDLIRRIPDDPRF